MLATIDKAAPSAAQDGGTKTLQLPEMFRNPSRWQLPSGESTVVPNVPVFDEHDEVDERPTVKDSNGNDTPNPQKGRLIRRFDAAKLQEICDRCNHRLQTTGDACPVTIGHTRPGEPESSQPAISGYAVNFHLGNFGPAGKLAILSDFYILPAMWQEFEAHPRRSVELFPKDNVFDPIAVLKRTPERDLGLIQSYIDARGDRGRNAAANGDGASTKSSIPFAATVKQVVRYQRRNGLHGEPIRYSIQDQSEGATMGGTMSGCEEKMGRADRFAKFYSKHVPYIRHYCKLYEKATGEKEPEGDGELSLKEQYAARRFAKHFLKHAYSFKGRKKRYEAETGDKDEEADQFEAADELNPQEEEEAEQHWKHYAKNKMLRYAFGLDEEAKKEGEAGAAGAEEETAAAAAGAAAAAPAASAAPAGPEDPGHDPEGELPPEHAHTADRYMKHHIRNNKVFRYMHQEAAKHYADPAMVDPAAAAAGAPPAPAAPAAPPAAYAAPAPAAAAAAPSAANVSVPGLVGDKKEPPTQFAKDAEKIQYARENAELCQRLDAALMRNDEIQKHESLAAGKLCVSTLMAQGFHFEKDEIDDEAEQYAKLDPTARQKRMEWHERHCSKNGAPVGGQPIHLGIFGDPQGVETIMNGRGAAEAFSKDDREVAVHMMETTGITYEAAVQKVKDLKRNKVKTA